MRCRSMPTSAEIHGGCWKNTAQGQYFAKERVRVDFVWGSTHGVFLLAHGVFLLTHGVAHAVNRTGPWISGRSVCSAHRGFNFGEATLPWKVAEQALKGTACTEHRRHTKCPWIA